VGGEHLDHEVADYPKLGCRMIRTREDIVIYELSSGRPFG
jgi:hypothetical protein